MDLRTSYQQTTHQLSGHGKRNVGVLQRAFEQADPEQTSDHYGTGEVIEQFEQKLATRLGTEAAVFFPSGTMAQQISLRIWSDETGNRSVAYHPLCHLEIHEQDGLRQLHHLEPLLIGGADRLMTLEEVKALPDVACLLVELPQRELGGYLPPFDELEAISRHCRDRGIHLHLDGARLFETLPYYEKTAEEVCALFDSVYVSFYKGIGGVAGAILGGPKAFCDEARIWKRRYGGDLIGLYPYIIPADYYYELRKDRMGTYYEHAKALATRFNALDGVWTTPDVPVTNMFHLHMNGDAETVSNWIERVQTETGIGITGYVVPHDSHCSTEISVGDAFLDIDTSRLDKLFEVLSHQQ
ncbi:MULTISPECIES: low specificity L-threonine aldolase [unclassified Exiguobacterium]|uniref:threonine aldolase family protein n=1 Tax=unclassified Exiguobacterium TaxID=2644629 RepID=UPI00103BFF65|nr:MULTISPECIES: beta-eliminating lyase-related protein [unclassified Exiguobacterium]TCI48487.1 low specificity L-threonine aldolase [Exiguobacterium sp. SH5S32]TCI55374.1 low specificity L-threonine aldolase [Exiguobacterium sp. SH1S4]TCI75168.1 low specificity L-threonine aldolase [Exiguobacterium sp. SH1S1]